MAPIKRSFVNRLRHIEHRIWQHWQRMRVKDQPEWIGDGEHRPWGYGRWTDDPNRADLDVIVGEGDER